MKFLVDRHEIAQAINIDRIPVITIDITKCMDGYEHCYEGDKVLVTDPKHGRHVRCTVKMYGDDNGNNDYLHPWFYKTICLMNPGAYISASFGYSDVMEMVEWSKSKVLDAGEEVIVMFNDRENKYCYLRRMRVSDSVNLHCQTAATLVDVDE